MLEEIEEKKKVTTVFCSLTIICFTLLETDSKNGLRILQEK